MAQLRTLQTGYTQVPNQLLNNSNISLKAKGLFAYLNSKPDGWNFCTDRIASQVKEGRDAVRNTLQELEKAGWIKRTPAKDALGKFDGYDYELMANPSTDNPSYGKPVDGNSVGHSNKEISKKDIEKKREGGEPKQQPSLPEKIQLILNQYPELTGHPALRSINDAIDDRPVEFVKWVLKNKTNVETLSKPIAWAKWFWEDYNTSLLKEKKLDEDLDWGPKYQARLDRIMAGFDKSDPSKLPKDHPDYWDDKLQARLDRIMAGG